MSNVGSGFRKVLVLVGVLALVVPLLFALATPVSAATLRVNNGVASCSDLTGNPYCTIQAAVNAAKGGDVIHVYPGTYNESVDLSSMNPQGDLTLVTVNAAGVPTPGTAEVHYEGPEPEIRTKTAFDGDLTIDGFVVYSDASGIDVEVESPGGADSSLVIRNVTATGTGDNGIVAEADGDVSIINCQANDNVKASGNGIVVEDTGGNVTVLDCEASGNVGTGIRVSNVDGTVTIRNCTANSNTGVGPADGGIVVRFASGTVSITNCTANGNTHVGFFGDSLSGALQISSCVFASNEGGVLFHELSVPDQVLVNESIICGNSAYGLTKDMPAATDAEGNWWGCQGGPGNLGCDAVSPGPPTVYFAPWIDTITASAPASAMAGEAAPVTFQFSDSGQTVFLGQGPGDLHGDPTFVVSTDNGTVVDPGFINEPQGVLAATLIPASGGTATVTLDGPCGLDAVVALGTWEFVPEPGSVLLLGSGLMGLAGYAGLRLRKR